MDIVNRAPSLYSGYAVSPVIYSSDTSQCGEDILEDAKLLGALDQAVQMLKVPRSCKDIFNASPSSSSGYYNITINNGSIVNNIAFEINNRLIIISLIISILMSVYYSNVMYQWLYCPSLL